MSAPEKDCLYADVAGEHGCALRATADSPPPTAVQMKELLRENAQLKARLAATPERRDAVIDAWALKQLSGQVANRIGAIRHLYGPNPDVKWLADRLDAASEAAIAAADFLDSYTDESELARAHPMVVEIMRSYAADLRAQVTDNASPGGER